MNWKNRIINSGALPANQYLAHDLNARRHPGDQRNALRGMLDSIGWVAPVVVSANSGKLLDGHLRIEEALSQDEEQLIPFVEVDVTAEEERLILATLDPITSLAGYDRDALKQLLDETSTENSALEDLMRSLASSKGLLLIDNVSDVWKGMPEFENGAVYFRSLIVNFENQTAVDNFARIIGQTLTDKTRSISYPHRPIQRQTDFTVVDIHEP